LSKSSLDRQNTRIKSDPQSLFHAVVFVNEGAPVYLLLDFTAQPHGVYTHRWRKGDVVMWDNCRLLHRPVRDYTIGRDRRFPHRMVIKGTVPVWSFAE